MSIEYQPLLKDYRNDYLRTNHSQKVYNKWVGILGTQLNPRHGVILYKSVPYHRIKDYKFVLGKLLKDIGENNNYIIYGKKKKLIKGYNIKAKPTNEKYRKRIVRKSQKTWDRVFEYFHDSIIKNPELRSVIIKKTNDRGLAEWYQTVVGNTFMDHLVEIQKIMTNDGIAKFQVIVHCNININLNQ